MIRLSLGGCFQSLKIEIEDVIEIPRSVRGEGCANLDFKKFMSNHARLFDRLRANG